jgi:DNA (cytosine-5)-methyltransferase 1
MLKILDLFCGQGGACEGIAEAVKDSFIVGVDIEDMLYYPQYFMQYDVMKLDKRFLQNFDLIWASPPCQLYTTVTNGQKEKFKHLDLLPDVRNMLIAAGCPYVIENVPGAPMRHDLVLQGDMFGLGVLRTRYFEVEGFEVVQPRKKRIKTDDYITVAGHADGLADYKLLKAMGITHYMPHKGIVNAVPPAYSSYIMNCFMRSVKRLPGIEC